MAVTLSDEDFAKVKRALVEYCEPFEKSDVPRLLKQINEARDIVVGLGPQT